MSTLLTPEEWAGSYLAGGSDTEAAHVIRALLGRIEDLDRLRREAFAQRDAAVEDLGVLRATLGAETDELLTARLRSVRTAVERIREATEDFQVAIGEDWR